MRTGYSNILGETIAAELLEYKDCELFQVVCPNCREPLFKAVRPKDQGATHFLSHYEAAKAYAADCELRAKSYDAAGVEAENLISRNQRLQYFIDRFAAMLDDLPLFTKPGARARWHDILRRNDVTRRVRETMYRAGSRVDLVEMIEGRAEELFALWDSEHFVVSTGFSREQQKRAACDMVKTMWTPNGRQAFNQTFTVAWAALASKVASLEREGSSPEFVKIVGTFVITMPPSPNAASKKLEAWVASTPVGPPYADTPGATWFDRICWSLWEEFAEVLLRVDYLGALKKRAGTTH